MTESRSIHLYPVITFLIIAIVGFADSVYLTASHYIGGIPTCTIVEGCDEVALSGYATIGSIPVALLGALFYAGMAVLAVVWLDVRIPKLFRYLPWVTVPAFLFSMWLVYLMIIVIDAICIYCLVSAGSTTLLMLLSLKLKYAT